MGLLQHTASLHGGSGHWNSCKAPPHCLGAVHGATPATHRLAAWGQWAVELLQRTGSLPGAVGSGALALHCRTAGGQWAVGSGSPAIHCLPAWKAVGSATPTMDCRTARGQWALELLQCTAAPPGGSGQWDSCDTLPRCLGGSGQWDSCNASPHCLGAVGSGSLARHSLSAWGQWAVERPQCTASAPGGSGQRKSCRYSASLPGGSGQWDSCNVLPYCLGAAGSGSPAIHYLVAWAQGKAKFL